MAEHHKMWFVRPSGEAESWLAAIAAMRSPDVDAARHIDPKVAIKFWHIHCVPGPGVWPEGDGSSGLRRQKVGQQNRRWWFAPRIFFERGRLPERTVETVAVGSSVD
jgi:hypothetical protein